MSSSAARWLQRIGEDVGERLHEVGVGRREASLRPGRQRQDSPAALAPVDLAGCAPAERRVAERLQRIQACEPDSSS